MDSVLVVDQDRTAVRRLGLACLERGMGVLVAENLCAAVRTLLSASVALVVVDAALLRLTAREHAALLDRVAPGVPRVVVVGPGTTSEARAALEVAGFRVLSHPVDVGDLLARVERPCTL